LIFILLNYIISQPPFYVFNLLAEN